MNFIRNLNFWRGTLDYDPKFEATYDLDAYGDKAEEASKIINRIKHRGNLNVAKLVGAGAIGFALTEIVRHSWEEGIVVGCGVLVPLAACFTDGNTDPLYRELNELRLPSQNEQD